jgi:DHA1 family bicyclomycin/chloramphenicol resistance-like MFS transporter
MRGEGPVSALTGAALVVLGFVQALWPLTMDLYLPSFPQMEADLQATPSSVSLTLTGAFIGMAIGQLTAGPLSDRVGRMRPLTIVLMIYAVASVGCALAPTIGVLVAARAVQGVGASAAAVITLAIVRDCAAGPRMVRLLARLQLINGAFVVISPALGAILLAVVPWRGLFWILVGFGGALLIAVVSTLVKRETLAPTRRQPAGFRALGRDYAALRRDRRYGVALVGNTLLGAGMMGYMASSSFLFQGVYGLSPTMYALVFGGHGAVMIIAAQVSAALTGRYGLRRVCMIGASAAAASGICLVLGVTLTPPATLASFLIPLLGFTASFGILAPCLQATALEPHGARAGTAASLLGASNMVASAVAAPVVASFGVVSSAPASIFLAACAVTAMVVVVLGGAGRHDDPDPASAPDGPVAPRIRVSRGAA